MYAALAALTRSGRSGSPRTTSTSPLRYQSKSGPRLSSTAAM
jgi:hypothetical protein